MRLFPLVGLLVLASSALAQAPRERTPHAKLPVVAPPLPPELPADTPRRLVVKFADAVRARVATTTPGGLRSRSGVDLTSVRELVDELGLRFRPLLAVPEAKLAGLEARATFRSGETQADLAGLMIVDVPSATSAGDLERVGQRLQELALVEYVEIETLAVPPPGDIAPATPDLTGNQDYLGPGAGLDVEYAWSLGYRGAGIRFSDCEYGWNAQHEDLNDIVVNFEPGQTIHPSVYTLGWDSHGTAVIGGSNAVDNAYGITGIATDADVHTYTEWSVEEGNRRATCIANAIADSSFGDVVLLEMQTNGAGGDFAPAEYSLAIWDIVRTGTQAGVVVVGAAGNGNQNLDAPEYAAYMARGDSGAILVGAGSSTANHDKLSFSTYGSRVDVQAWGQNVFTLGYGGFAAYGGDKNQRYTATFSGTSSASGLTGPACVVLQSAAVGMLGERMPPKAMRKLLRETGSAQGSGGPIGPCVDLRAAIDGLPTLLYVDFVGTPKNGDAPHAVDFTSRSFGTIASYQWSFGDGQTSNEPSPTHVYTTPGTYSVSLLISGPGGVEGLTRTDYITVAEALAITEIKPTTVPALVPGTDQTVTLTGTEFTPDVEIEVNGVPVDPSSFTVIGKSAITLDMPQVDVLGRTTITVSDGIRSDSTAIEITAPATPVLQIGNGVVPNAQSYSNGLDVVVAGQPGALHFVLYSGSDLPSSIPLIDLAIGNFFSDLFLSSSHTIGEAGWTAQTLPLSSGAFATFYLQSLTLDGSFPIPTSNLQAVLVTPF